MEEWCIWRSALPNKIYISGYDKSRIAKACRSSDYFFVINFDYEFEGLEGFAMNGESDFLDAFWLIDFFFDKFPAVLGEW